MKRRPHAWLESRALPLSLGATAAIVAAVLFLVFWPWERVTRENFGKVQVGMSRSQLLDLLGPPDYDVNEIGFVGGPEYYATNRHLSKEELLELGYRAYRRHQWSSRKLSISAVLDSDGRVACRYAGPGHSWNWIDRIHRWWVSSL